MVVGLLKRSFVFIFIEAKKSNWLFSFNENKNIFPNALYAGIGDEYTLGEAEEIEKCE